MINASLSRKNKKKGVEMSDSADWMHKPHLVLNSLDRISKLVASIGKGGGIPIPCLSNESNPKFAELSLQSKSIDYCDDQDK